MITPVESTNVLKVTMKFYGVYKYKSPSKRRRDQCRRAKFLANLSANSFPGAWSISRASLPRWTCLHYHCHCPPHTGEADGRRDEGGQPSEDCLAVEAEEAEEEWGRMVSHVHDLINKRSDLQGEIHQLEQELKRTKEELAQLKTRKKELGGLQSKSNASRIIQCFRAIKGCFSWAKCTQKEKEE